GVGSRASGWRPVGAKTGGIGDVLHAGDPKVRMQRPCAKPVSGAPTAAIPSACSSRRRVTVWSFIRVVRPSVMWNLRGRSPKHREFTGSCPERCLGRVSICVPEVTNEPRLRLDLRGGAGPRRDAGSGADPARLLGN